MIANKNALGYLKENMRDLDGVDFQKEIYFLIPDKYRKDNGLIEELKEWVTNFEGQYFAFDFDVIYYKDNVKLVAINEQNFNGSCYLRNPVIIYNNIDASKANYEIDTEWFKNSYEYNIMYALSEPEWQSFIDENHLENEIHSITNVYDNYLYHWTILKRTAWISFALCLLALCLESIVIQYIIKLEYEANAIELSLKKILGYSIWEKNSKIVILTLAASIISVVASCVIGIVLRLSETKFMVLGGILIGIMEMAMIFWNIQKIEKANIQKILKGGSL